MSPRTIQCVVKRVASRGPIPRVVTPHVCLRYTDIGISATRSCANSPEEKGVHYAEPPTTTPTARSGGTSSPGPAEEVVECLARHTPTALQIRKPRVLWLGSRVIYMTGALRRLLQEPRRATLALQRDTQQLIARVFHNRRSTHRRLLQRVAPGVAPGLPSRRALR